MDRREAGSEKTVESEKKAREKEKEKKKEEKHKPGNERELIISLVRLTACMNRNVSEAQSHA